MKHHKLPFLVFFLAAAFFAIYTFGCTCRTTDKEKTTYQNSNQLTSYRVSNIKVEKLYKFLMGEYGILKLTVDTTEYIVIRDEDAVTICKHE